MAFVASEEIGLGAAWWTRAWSGEADRDTVYSPSMSFGKTVASLMGAVVAIATLANCGASGAGQFAEKGFQQSKSQYQIAYLDASARRLLPQDWRLDNYYLGPKKELLPKSGGIYESDFEFDFDDNGKSDKADKLFTYEVRYTHLRTAGVLWVRAIPVAQYEGAKALDVLLQGYLNGIAGAGFEVARLGQVEQVTAKRYAPSLVSTVKATLAGKEALASVIDIANVDEVQVTPTARRERVKLVLVRSGYFHEVTLDKLNRTYRYPVILVAGYSNQPDYFEQNLPDFDGFLQRFAIGSGIGYKEEALKIPVMAAPPPQVATSALPSVVAAAADAPAADAPATP